MFHEFKNVITDLRSEILDSSGHDENRNYYGMSNPLECVVAIWHKLHNHKAIVKEEQQLRIAQAYMNEKRFLNLLKRRYEISHRNTSIRDFHNNDEILAPEINGHIECLLKLKDKDILIEIKAPNIKNYIRMYREKLLNDRHYNQVQMYLHFLKLETALVLIVNPESGIFFFIKVTYSSQRAKWLLEKVENRLSVAKRTVMPETRHNPNTDYECKLCGFKYLCSNEKNKMNKILSRRFL